MRNLASFFSVSLFTMVELGNFFPEAHWDLVRKHCNLFQGKLGPRFHSYSDVFINTLTFISSIYD